MIMSPVASRRRQRMTQKIERVVQVDVGQERRDHRALPYPLVTDRHDPVFQNARLEPLADQADDAPVADPMLHEPYEPFLAHRVEERSDVGVQYHAAAPPPRRVMNSRRLRPSIAASSPGGTSILRPPPAVLAQSVCRTS